MLFAVIAKLESTEKKSEVFKSLLFWVTRQHIDLIIELQCPYL